MSRVITLSCGVWVGRERDEEKEVRTEEEKVGSEV